MFNYNESAYQNVHNLVNSSITTFIPLNLYGLYINMI